MRAFAFAVCLLTVPAYGQTVCKNGRCYQAPPATVSVSQPLPTGITLRPGERLVSIDGKPVGGGSAVLPSSAGLLPYEINRDQRAYTHAKREAQILAARSYSAGHPLGCAPGCNRSGTGWSYSGRPNHCYYGELPESRIVARACVRGSDGRYVWSCHYR